MPTTDNNDKRIIYKAWEFDKKFKKDKIINVIIKERL